MAEEYCWAITELWGGPTAAEIYTGFVWEFGWNSLRTCTYKNYPQDLVQDAVCQSHTGHMTGLWFLPARPLRLNTNE